MKMLLVLFSAFVCNIAFANVNCEGIIPIAAWKSTSDVGIDFDKLEVGRQIGLWAPVTDDNGDYLTLEILSTEDQGNGRLLVKGQYVLEEISKFSFVHVKTAAGVVSIEDFKGIEGGVEFGPGNLSCN